MNNWWEDFFSKDFAQAVLSQTIPQIDLDFIESVTKIRSGSIVFDQCCGKGILSHALADKFKVKTIGVDIVKSLIDCANANKNSDLSAFVCADAKKYIPVEQCDVAINWYTSFAYDADDSENIKMLKMLAKSLKRNGKFIINTINPEFVYKNFKPKFIREVATANGKITIVQNNFLEDKMAKSTWDIEYPDGRHDSAAGQTKLYTSVDFISNLFPRCGLVLDKLYGNTRSAVDETYKIDGIPQRLILVGHKK